MISLSIIFLIENIELWNRHPKHQEELRFRTEAEHDTTRRKKPAVGILEEEHFL